MASPSFLDLPPGTPVSASRVFQTGADPARFAAPQGDGVTLADWDDPRSPWIWVSATGKPGRAISSFISAVLRAQRPVIHGLIPDEPTHYDKKLTRIGSFAIEHLYLDVMAHQHGNSRAFDAAARLSLVLTSYWADRMKKGDPDARFQFPMAARVCWLSFHGLRRVLEASWVKHRGELPHTEDATVDEERLALYRRVKRDPTDSWLQWWLVDDWFQQASMNALRDWQAACIGDEHAHFFIQVLLPWLEPAHGDWQRLREDELNRTIWSDVALPSPIATANATPNSDHWWRTAPVTKSAAGIRASTVQDRAALTYVLENWYLPRYDLRRAAAVNAAIAVGEFNSRHPKPHWWQRRWNTLRAFMSSHLAWISPLGIERLLGGIGAAYLVTVFTPDIWELLDAMVWEQPEATFALLVALLMFPLWWLARGIRRQIGFRSWWISLRRALRLWMPGVITSLILGIFFASTVSPITIACKEPMPSASLTITNWWTRAPSPPQSVQDWFSANTGILGCNGVWIIIVYAQIAVAIGIFVQLLFDDKPATAPLDAP